MMSSATLCGVCFLQCSSVAALSYEKSHIFIHCVVIIVTFPRWDVYCSSLSRPSMTIPPRARQPCNDRYECDESKHLPYPPVVDLRISIVGRLLCMLLLLACRGRRGRWLPSRRGGHADHLLLGHHGSISLKN